MIERVRVRNFRKLRELDINFTKGVNVIVGDNGAGKSALIGALSWVLFNRPDGTRHISHGASFSSVVVTYDGHKVKRKRSESENTYTFNGVEQRAFNRGVPDIITAAYKGMAAVNIQRQHDPMFWLSLGPTELGAELLKMADIETLLKVNDLLKKRTNTIVKERDAHQTMLDHHSQAIKELQPAAKQLQALKVFAGVNELLRSAQDRLEEFKRLSERRRSLRQHLKGLREAKERLNNLQDAMDRHTKAQIKLRKFLKLCDQRSTLRSQLKGLNKAKDSIKICPTCKKEL